MTTTTGPLEEEETMVERVEGEVSVESESALEVEAREREEEWWEGERGERRGGSLLYEGPRVCLLYTSPSPRDS